ncbi:NAD-binding protein [Haladaptatus sp. GCM10025707]|uniref:NAD-binding protein n=1 Tax=unclassified Haladaptatus TaxID=2622732 RepID=UPI0023E89B4D|nr:MULTISPECIES: NAD-binding protein [unclassified Haladaptatus]
MERRRAWFSTRIAILLTLAVALLSFATGVANIATPTVVPGPLSPYVPDAVQETAGFTGALTGFLLLVGVLGLRRGLEAGWILTMVLLPLTAAQGLLQSNSLSLPLVALSLLALPVVGLHRKRFTQEISLSTTQLGAVAAIVGAQIYGTVGTFALREQFTGINNLVDAFYFTLVTASTVGYGDASPATPVARLFGMTVIVIGTASFAIALGSVLGPAIEARFSRALGIMSESQLATLENHVVVLGYGELTEPILEELQTTSEFVVVVPDKEHTTDLSDRGYKVLTGEPSDEPVLERVGIDRAKAVVAATNSDAEDALSILTARQLNPDINIVAAATERENIQKLKRAGADTVISPAVIGGHLLVQSALGQRGMEAFADRILDVDEKNNNV